MTIKTQDGKVVTKNGKVSCECCEEDCPTVPDSPYGIILTQEQYGKFKSGGVYSMTATLYESQTTYGQTFGPCSVTLNGSGTLIGSCSFSAEVRQTYCTSGAPFFPDAHFSLNWYVCKESGTGLYKFRYMDSGFFAGACPYPITMFGPPICYSAGYSVSETFAVNPPSYFAQVGTVTINNRGAQVELGIWSFPPQTGFSSSASVAITIT